MIHYLSSQLRQLIKEFPGLKIKCGWSKGSNEKLMVVELSDFSNKQLDEKWIPISIYCKQNYTEDIIFTDMKKRQYLKIDDLLLKL